MVHFLQICTHLIRDVSSCEGHYCLRALVDLGIWNEFFVLFCFHTNSSRISQAKFPNMKHLKDKIIKVFERLHQSFTLCFHLSWSMLLNLKVPYTVSY